MGNTVCGTVPNPGHISGEIPKWFSTLDQRDAKVRGINQLLTPIDDAHCIRISARVQSPDGFKFESISICRSSVDITHLDWKIYNAVKRSDLNVHTLAAIAIILRDNSKLFGNFQSIEGSNAIVVITDVEGSNIVLIDPKIESVLHSSIENYF